MTWMDSVKEMETFVQKVIHAKTNNTLNRLDHTKIKELHDLQNQNRLPLSTAKVLQDENINLLSIISPHTQYKKYRLPLLRILVRLSSQYDYNKSIPLEDIVREFPKVMHFVQTDHEVLDNRESGMGPERYKQAIYNNAEFLDTIGIIDRPKKGQYMLTSFGCIFNYLHANELLSQDILDDFQNAYWQKRNKDGHNLHMQEEVKRFRERVFVIIKSCCEG